MTPNLLRGSLFVTGAGLIVYSFPIAFFTTWFWTVAIVGAVLIIVGGLVRRDDLDDHYASTPRDDEFNQIVGRLGEFGGVWPNSAGGVE